MWLRGSASSLVEVVAHSPLNPGARFCIAMTTVAHTGQG